MNSGSFDQGILNMTNWLGNGIMPVLAALMVAMGIYRFSRGGDFERWIWGALGSLSVSGLLRLTEVFARQGCSAFHQQAGWLRVWTATVEHARRLWRSDLPQSQSASG